MSTKQIAVLKIDGDTASAKLLADKFSAVFAARKLKPKYLTESGEHAWLFAADPQPDNHLTVLRGWRPEARRVASFSVFATLMFDDVKPVRVTLTEAEADSDGLAPFPYDSAEAIEDELRAAVNTFRKSGKARYEYEPSEEEKQRQRERSERAQQRVQEMGAFYKLNRSAVEQEADQIETWQRFWDAQHAAPVADADKLRLETLARRRVGG